MGGIYLRGAKYWVEMKPIEDLKCDPEASTRAHKEWTTEHPYPHIDAE